MSENTDTIDEMAKEMDELEAENQSLRTQLSEAQTREAAVKIALEKWSNAKAWGGDELDELIKTIEALSTSSPAADRWKAMEAAVEAAKNFFKCTISVDGNKCLYDCVKEPCPYDGLSEALAALEGGKS